ncbi:hypothetical protein UNDKW_5420 [Undibacterium sp. KW1]|uniref:hypothetical protein n=1 Tax=Undibacterium sp. KW1 TaxID=2058624 RepID=UPI001331D224|nr:hypothetical protein [Undibacterium sp. KW1]BBB63693.1 hypothetical protein UNDKW_5420 [Undibacterium sp. KW1]
MTFGLTGTMVTGDYIMNASYVSPGKDEIKHSYKHAIHTMVSNADGPKGLQPVPKVEAIRGVTEGLLLNLRNDM